MSIVRKHIRDGLVINNIYGNTGDLRHTGSIPEWYGNPLQYSCLENSVNRRTWQVTVHSLLGSQGPWGHKQTQLKRLSTHRYVREASEKKKAQYLLSTTEAMVLQE